MIPISQPLIGQAERDAVQSVLDSGMLAQGEWVARLERYFAELCGVRHGIATSSGTAALHVALLAHGIGPGDEVITTPFTFIATVNTILFTGARPVFVDIEPDTFNIDTRRLRRAISSRTKAILPVHLYGHPCEMDELLNVASEHGLAIIEDACQAVGARYHGHPVGGFGTGCFSLYATKNIAAGEGGMITTDDDLVAEQCRLLRNHGMRRKYHHEMVGYNLRMTDLHAAIGCVQFERLAEFTQARRANAAYLGRHLQRVVVPLERVGCEHVWHQYTIRLSRPESRDDAIAQLAAGGVTSAVFYPVPTHEWDFVRELVGDATYPVSEQMAREVLSLPVHPGLSAQDLERIGEEVNRL